jgi:hypothetical protein
MITQWILKIEMIYIFETLIKKSMVFNKFMVNDNGVIMISFSFITILNKI